MAMDRQEEILEELEEAETESAAESEELREELAPEEETPPEDPEEAAALEAPGAGQGDTGYEWVESIIEIAAAVGLLLAAAFGLIKLRHWLWRRKLERTSRRVRILLLYCKMLEMLKMLNEQERPWSLIELEEVDAGQAAELITETVVGLNTEQVQTFLELAEEESFGKRVVSADEYDSSLAMLREMYARLQAAFPWYLKFLLWVNCGAIL